MAISAKGARTKQRILDAATNLIWHNSFHNVTVDRIVDEAEVNKASFYQYFESKNEILDKSLNQLFESTTENNYEQAFEKREDPIDRLEYIFKSFYNFHKKQKREAGYTPGCPFINIGSELCSQDREIGKTVSKMMDRFSNYHKTIYEDTKKQSTKASDSKKFGKQLQGILNSGMLSAKIKNRPEEILDALETAKMVISVA